MSSYDRNMAYRAERLRLVEQSQYTMRDAIAECEAEEKTAQEKAARAAEPQIYTFEVRDPKTGASLGKRTITYSTEAELRTKLAEQTKQLRLHMNWDTFSTAPADAQRADSAAEYDDAALAQVQRDTDEFLRTEPSYVANDANFSALATFIGNHQLKPNLASFRQAFRACAQAGLFTDNRGVPIPPTTGPVKAYRPGDEITYQLPNGGRLLTGREAVENMDMKTYRQRLLNEKDFAAKVDRLLSEKR